MGDTRTTRGNSERWRVFAALPVADGVRSQMAFVVDELRPRGWPVKWVDPTLAHLTVRFYGNVSPVEAVSLQHHLAMVAAASVPARVRADRIGAFPSPSRPRVIWIGLGGDVKALGEVAADVAATTAHIGEPDTRPFKPHITVGRLRQGARPPSDFAAAVNELRLPPIEFSIDRLQLIRSVLSPTGPTYTVIDAWPLGQPLAVAGKPTPELREYG